MDSLSKLKQFKSKNKSKFDKVMAITRKYSKRDLQIVEEKPANNSRMSKKPEKRTASNRYSLRTDFGRRIFDKVKNENIRSSLRALDSGHEARRLKISEKFNLGRKKSKSRTRLTQSKSSKLLTKLGGKFKSNRQLPAWSKKFVKSRKKLGYSPMKIQKIEYGVDSLNNSRSKIKNKEAKEDKSDILTDLMSLIQKHRGSKSKIKIDINKEDDIVVKIEDGPNDDDDINRQKDKILKLKEKIKNQVAQEIRPKI
jgi:hypothetical protein